MLDFSSFFVPGNLAFMTGKFMLQAPVKKADLCTAAFKNQLKAPKMAFTDEIKKACTILEVCVVMDNLATSW